MIPQIPSEAGCDKSRSTLTVNVPKLASFHVPRGPHTSTIKSVTRRRKETARSSISIVRFVFSPHIADPKFNYLAKIDFKEDMSEGSDLWNVLCRLVGRKALEDCSGGQFNLRSLEGIECDIEIEHVYDGDCEYEFPLVKICDIQRAGMLVLRDDA